MSKKKKTKKKVKKVKKVKIVKKVRTPMGTFVKKRKHPKHHRGRLHPKGLRPFKKKRGPKKKTLPWLEKRRAAHLQSGYKAAHRIVLGIRDQTRGLATDWADKYRNPVEDSFERSTKSSLLYEQGTKICSKKPNSACQELGPALEEFRTRRKELLSRCRCP